MVDATLFRSIVGAIQYLTFTRPDIIHALNQVCQHFSNPTLANLRAINRILQYLKGTQHFGLRYLYKSPSSSMAFVMFIGLVVPPPDVVLQDIVFSLELIAFLGVPRSKQQLLNRVIRQNIILWRMPLLS